MRVIIGVLVAVALAGVVAYAIRSGATPAPVSIAGLPWFVTIDEERGTVSLAAGDFDAIVFAYNQQRDEILRLRIKKECR
jgi:hypothetical protein